MTLPSTAMIVPRRRSTWWPRRKNRWLRKRYRTGPRKDEGLHLLTPSRIYQVILSLEKLTQLAQVDRTTIETETVQRTLEGMQNVTRVATRARH